MTSASNKRQGCDLSEQTCTPPQAFKAVFAFLTAPMYPDQRSDACPQFPTSSLCSLAQDEAYLF